MDRLFSLPTKPQGIKTYVDPAVEQVNEFYTIMRKHGLDGYRLSHEQMYKELKLSEADSWSDFEKRKQGRVPNMLSKIYVKGDQENSITLQHFLRRASIRQIKTWPQIYVDRKVALYSLKESIEDFKKRVLISRAEIYNILWVRDMFWLEKIGNTTPSDWGVRSRGVYKKHKGEKYYNTLYRINKPDSILVSEIELANKIKQILKNGN